MGIVLGFLCLDIWFIFEFLFFGFILCFLSFFIWTGRDFIWNFRIVVEVFFETK